MKTESLRNVRNNLSSMIEELRKTGPVLITKNGKTRAMLSGGRHNTDLESLLLANSPRFWELFDRAARGRKWTRLEEIGRASCRERVYVLV